MNFNSFGQLFINKILNFKKVSFSKTFSDAFFCSLSHAAGKLKYLFCKGKDKQANVIAKKIAQKRQKDKSMVTVTFCHFIDISKTQYEDIIGFHKDTNLSDKIPFMVSG